MIVFSSIAFSKENDSLILPKYFTESEKEAKEGGRVEKKIKPVKSCVFKRNWGNRA